MHDQQNIKFVFPLLEKIANLYSYILLSQLCRRGFCHSTFCRLCVCV